MRALTAHRTTRAAQAADAPVVAVITDAAVAVEVARRAAQLAADEHRPLLLLVPLPTIGFTIDPVVLRLAHQRREANAAAILGRITPALGAARTDTAVRILPHRGDTGEQSPAVAKAVLAAATRAHAAVLVAPGTLPLGASATRHRHRTVLIDPEQHGETRADAQETVSRPAATVRSASP